MALSGHKICDFEASVSHGSAENFEHSCDYCLTDGQHVEAHGFCVHCNEYLCKHCLRYHRRNKASMDHQIVGKDEIEKHVTNTKSTKICTEKCSIHKDEIIKFFCTGHNEIGCHDCMTMNHRTCDLDYIPDKCADIGDSAEYREIMRNVEEKMKEVNTLIKTATSKDKEIDYSYDKADKEFVTFRKELNDHLDILHTKIAICANKKKSVSKQEVRTILDKCKNVESEMKNLHSTLQHDKSIRHNAQLFIDIKRAASRLQSKEVDEAKFALAEVNTQITFRRSKDLEHILSKHDFGKLTQVSTASRTIPHRVSPTSANILYARKTNAFSSINHKPGIHVKTKSNNYECSIMGMAVFSPSEMLVADHNNNSLKFIDIQKRAVVEENYLDSEPWNIAMLPQDTTAVTLLDKKQILITTAGKLSVDRSIKDKGECRGLTYHQDCLYLLCWNPYIVSVLDMTGNVKDTITLSDKGVFSSPNYITVSQDHQHLYVSNFDNNSVVSVTLQGEVSAVYKHGDLDGPLGMLVLDDGSLLVCCNNNNTIHHISKDLKQGKTVLRGLVCPCSICYSADRSQVYVGCINDYMAVCDILYRN